ncbi:hypothetical protein [Bacillus sp. PS06]|uniref:hypothetical protein n=1 Tax=Bacillus sp. PS06 TaxID=2764176 RepID=UPI00177F7297|nr:hypothetical protein [Bacillus sp. PS06]MBD8069177.1 hypothetical protein [Bacillus sp. PS06]
MDDKIRKQIIIKEITDWKQSRLLPEEYCNFLLTLYTEGNQELLNAESGEKKKARKTIIPSIAIFLLLLISFLVTYFTEINLVLQIVIFSIFIIICVLGAVIFRKNQLLQHFSYIIGAIIFLFASVHICDRLFIDNQYAMLVTVMLHTILWLCLGIFLKKKYFLISSVLGLLLIIITFIKWNFII